MLVRNTEIYCPLLGGGCLQELKLNNTPSAKFVMSGQYLLNVNARISSSRFLEPQTRVCKIYERMSDLDDVAYQTLELLESRLRRVAFVLDGDLRQDESKQKRSLSVPER